MKKKILFGIVILLAISFFAYRYTYQDHRDISSEEATYVVSIPELKKEFWTNDSLALSKYQNQTIEVAATVTAIDSENKAVVLDNNLFATFTDSLPKAIISGKKLKIKGRFLGYDELLEEFKMDQSSIIQ
ncbi:OB-fold protein [Flavobacterium eburneipallidum]|uniref:OB-fold protein n=1 Tax=Flavobacterium eburneipallidum TaxID=3003263 RepID=UPI002482849D|nr:hypothetical protein [Flavobacterium eburneipallidum]